MGLPTGESAEGENFFDGMRALFSFTAGAENILKLFDVLEAQPALQREWQTAFEMEGRGTGALPDELGLSIFAKTQLSAQKDLEALLSNSKMQLQVALRGVDDAIRDFDTLIPGHTPEISKRVRLLALTRLVRELVAVQRFVNACELIRKSGACDPSIVRYQSIVNTLRRGKVVVDAPGLAPVETSRKNVYKDLFGTDDE